MKSIIYALLCCALIFMDFVSAKPLKADDLFDNPNIAMVQLSPSGDYISVHQIKEKNHFLSLFNSTTFTLDIALSIGNDNRLNDYYWLNDQQLLIDLSRDGRHIYLIGNLVEGKIVASIVKADGYLVHSLPEQPNKIMFAKRTSRKWRSHDLYVVDIDSLVSDDFDQAYKVKHNENGIEYYYFDNFSKRVITSEYDEEKKSITIKFVPFNGGKWKTIITLKDTDFELKPLDFITEESLAVLTNKDTDKMVLRSFDIKTQTLGDIIYQHPKYDLTSAGLTVDGELDFVTFKQHGLSHKLYFDKGKAHFRKRLTKTFVNQEVYIVDNAVNKKISLLYANGSDEPGQYYLYEQETDKAVLFLSSYTKLFEQKFFPSTQLTIKTTDNIELEAFLTLPEGVDHSTLLVMPHGGPIGVQESDRFNKEVQYYVSRGFSVLRVNFRGSAGFGKEFLQQGVGEFGKQIEQDISAAVAKVKEKHKFKYQCAMGASYGGYSSTMLAITHPDEYDCVIAAFGVYDLPLMFNASNYRSGAEYRKNVEKTVGKYDEDLNLVSPVYIAERLKSPILLIAGRDDDTADFEHSNRFKYVLKKQKHPVETMFYQRTGHGHHYWSGDIHEAAFSYDFLMRTLKLTPPDPNQLDKNSRQAIAEDYAAIADGYNFKDLVDDDEDKAFEYYQKAAFYDHPRANFNIASHYHTGDQVTLNLDKAVDYYRASAKLDYDSAYSRLGRMYMEGEHLLQNWQAAQDNLLKAQKLKDSALNNIRLARFYCIAPQAYQDVDKCLELMDLQQYKNISKREVKRAKEHIRETLAWIFSAADLTKEEHQRIKQFAIDTFELNITEVVLEDNRYGHFEFIESDEFGKKGEYSLLQNHSEILSSDDEKDRFGLIFKVDVPGVNRKSDMVGLAARWVVTSVDGKKRYIDNTILYGSPIGDWKILRSLSTIKQSELWTLELHDFEQKLLLRKQFKVAPNASSEVSSALGMKTAH